MRLAMTVKDEDLAPLRDLESTILALWKQHPEMSDYVASRAYEAAFQFYRARLRGHEPKRPTEPGLDAEAFAAVQQTCETLLTSGPTAVKGLPDSGPVALDKLVDLLRELRRSAERHTAIQGRQGYLSFVAKYVR